MKKTPILITAGIILVAGAAVIFLRSGNDDRSNLLLITLDTTRADHIGCYGYAKAQTPALDRLARSGVKFNRAYSTVPLTLPAHATILTGLYPAEHGCRVNGAHRLGDDLTTLAEIFAADGYRTGAFIAAFVLNSTFGLAQGFETYDDYDVPTADEIYDENLMYRYRRADRVAGAALSWLENNSDQPFFCWIHFFDPHRPYYFPGDGEDLSVPYDQEIAFMDQQIGRIIDYLKREELLEETVIMAVGDHGESLGEHGEEEHGLFLYEGAVHVPLILSQPGLLPEGKEVESACSLIDIFPTVLELFGRKTPDRIPGGSLAPVMRSEKIKENPIYLETDFPLTEYGWSPLRAILKEEWKYISAPRPELYNLAEDPEESTNLIVLRPEKADRLKRKLDQLEKTMAEKDGVPVSLDETSQRTLESLGYLGSGGGKQKDTGSLRDPKDAIGMRKEFIAAVEDYQRGRREEAENKLKELVRKSPESYTFRYKLAKIYFEEEQFSDARTEFEELVKMIPDEYRTHYNLGKTLIKLGEYDRAIKELETALEFDPLQTPGYNNLGIALLRSGRLREAMGVFQKSIEIDDRQVDPHNNLGNAFLTLRRPRLAMKEFQRAVEIDPDFFEGHYNLGLVLFRLGAFEKAAEAFRRALRIRPNFADARKQLRRALSRDSNMQ